MTPTRLILQRSMILAGALVLLLCGIAALTQDAPQSPSEIVYERQAPGMTHPKAIYQPPPEYSSRAARKKIQGNVFLSLIVNADGTARDLKVTQSLDKDLDNKALECVRKWKFEPATKDGTPVAMRIVVEVNFHLY
jgi:TonB family protein